MNRTLTDSMIARLNSTCATRRVQGECERECWWVGWCDPCWESVGWERPQNVAESYGNVLGCIVR